MSGAVLDQSVTTDVSDLLRQIGAINAERKALDERADELERQAASLASTDGCPGWCQGNGRYHAWWGGGEYLSREHQGQQGKSHISQVEILRLDGSRSFGELVRRRIKTAA